MTKFFVGPNGQEVFPALRDLGNGTIEATYTPSQVGEHRIEVKYHGLHIRESPFTARAWDAGMVTVTNIHAGRIQKPYNFNSE